MMLQMDACKPEPLLGIEHAKAGVFHFAEPGCAGNIGHYFVQPFFYFDDEVAGFFFTDIDGHTGY